MPATLTGQAFAAVVAFAGEFPVLDRGQQLPAHAKRVGQVSQPRFRLLVRPLPLQYGNIGLVLLHVQDGLHRRDCFVARGLVVKSYADVPGGRISMTTMGVMSARQHVSEWSQSDSSDGY